MLGFQDLEPYMRPRRERRTIEARHGTVAHTTMELIVTSLERLVVRSSRTRWMSSGDSVEAVGLPRAGLERLLQQRL